jgi:chloramphenicol-sensitive protein RarD
MNKGSIYAICAYFLWGIFPVYWKMIHSVPAIEIIGHRMVWSFIFVILIIFLSGNWSNFRHSIKNPKYLLPFVLTAILLSVNWLTYVWAVNSGHIVETSLGYFINPLVSVLLGVFFLKERLRVWQWISVFLAGLGIGYLTWRYGSLPWIGLTLAFSFAFYGLIKKRASLNSIQGFAVETGIMFLPAIVYLMVIETSGRGALGNQSFWVICLLVFAGVATGLPLLLFGAAARKINLSTLGFLQYIAPTLQFLIGVLIYGESFTRENFLGFGLIWLALILFSIEAAFSRRKGIVWVPAD